MDFKLEYTPEQEKFRDEVRAWFEANVPMEMRDTPATRDIRFTTREELQWAREFRKKLGAKGWLDPLAPKEYGGGGMSVEEAVIIDEVNDEYHYPVTGDLGVSLGLPALITYGTEEQRKYFLPPILGGEKITWQFFSEPNAGTDLAGIQATANWNADEKVWIINGTKHYGGGPFFEPDLKAHYGYGPFVTETDAPRHQNMTAFMIPLDQPGVTVLALDMIHTRRISCYMDNVVVPDDHRIGARGQGWRVVNATLEREHGGGGSAVAKPRFREDLLNLLRNTGMIAGDDDAQEALMDYYMSSEVSRLFATRNYWMRASHQRWAHEGSQNSCFDKSERMHNELRLLQALGPQALLDLEDARTMLKGRMSAMLRNAHGTPAGGTVEAQKIVMGRRIGIGRHVAARAEVVA